LHRGGVRTSGTRERDVASTDGSRIPPRFLWELGALHDPRHFMDDGALIDSSGRPVDMRRVGERLTIAQDAAALTIQGAAPLVAVVVGKRYRAAKLTVTVMTTGTATAFGSVGLYCH
jgi:hypothetical protein